MKWCGKIGFGESVETKPGIWVDKIVERKYSGLVLQNTHLAQSAQQANDEINVNNQISVVADPYANQNFQGIRYVTWMGSKWKVTSARIQYPRIVLTIGGVYKGE